MREVGLHSARRYEKPRGKVGIAEPLADESDASVTMRTTAKTIAAIPATIAINHAVLRFTYAILAGRAWVRMN